MIRLTFRSVPDPGPPPEVPAGLQGTMDTAAIAAVVELFAAYRVTLTPMNGAQDGAPAPDLAALGIVRFTAPGLTGTAVLGCSKSTLRRSNMRGTSDRDWIAELSNQFIGRLKLKLLRAGFELWSMMPLTTSGRLLASAVTQPEAPPTLFADAKGGSVAAWIEMEISGPLKVTAPAADGDIPREGDIILF